MTAKELLSLSLIFLGMLCVIYSLLAFVGIFEQIAYESFVLGEKDSNGHLSANEIPSMTLFWYYVFPILSFIWYAIFGYLLIKQNEWITGKLLNEHESQTQLSFIMHQKLLFLLAVIIIGIITMIYGAPALLAKINQIMQQARISGEMTGETKAISHYIWDKWQPIIDPIAKVIIGLYLMTAGWHHYKPFALIKKAIRGPHIEY